jgi:hypothetical protein
VLNIVNPLNHGISIKLSLPHESKNADNINCFDGFCSFGIDIGANQNDKNSIRYQGGTIQPVGAKRFASGGCTIRPI